MPAPQQPLPAGGRSREAAALMEIAHTTVSPTTVRLLLAFFLAAIAGVPAIEIWVSAARGGGGVAVAYARLSDAVDRMRSAAVQAGGSSLWLRITAGNNTLLNGLNAFERALEDESLIARALRSPAQLALTRWLGAGNERVYPGRDRWLFYRPDVEYLTGRGFLDASQMARRVKEAPVTAAPPQPDPHHAIVRFKNDLAARGIALVVMPTPHKPSVHPDQLAARYRTTRVVLQNPSFEAFVERLERDGVLVFRPLSVLRELGLGSPHYLAADTHWRPEAMEAVAERLARFIVARVPLDSVQDPGYRIERAEIKNMGDTARMLDLPRDAGLYPPEAVWLRRVLHADGSVWRSSPSSDVLVLGDSFTNIYALESMGWGTSAGLAEQLSSALRRPVDRIVQNDEGAFATRALLARSPRRLDGKKVVVYQFADRELAFGDWQLIGLPDSATP